MEVDGTLTLIPGSIEKVEAMVISRLHTADDLKELAAPEGDFELIEGELF